MKRTISLIAALFLLISLFAMSGCSDFSFNPIGQWTLTDDILYAGDKVINSATAEENALMKDISFIFYKSGTGVFRTMSDNRYDRNFTYEYDDHTVTVTYTEPFQGKMQDPITLTLSEDGSALLINNYSTVKEQDGHSVELKEQFVYTKK